MEKIDFVVTWVDGNDPGWLAERAQYLPVKQDTGNSSIRFRDWDLMKYWFRGVEKFAPWVNNVYFVTWGHIPEWLNTKHPKLRIVDHAEYIPQQYLPTFNSNVIELNLHRIPELSEKFVLFNDDTLLTDHVTEKDFFKKGLPCDTVILGQGFATSPDDIFSYTTFNNVAIINKYFDKKRVIKTHWKKLFSLKTGNQLIRNFLLLPFGHFSGFLDCHLPASHLKSNFIEIWDREGKVLDECCLHRFRSKCDVTHWLMKNWCACKGMYMPRNINWGKSYSIGDDVNMLSAIESQKYKVVCLNDCNEELDFEKWKRLIAESFEKLLPDVSSFEIDAE